MKYYSVFFLIIALPLAVMSQSAEQNVIVKAIQSGNAKTISSYFTQSVDLTVKDSEGVFSKEQADVILSRFFNDNTPTSFSVKHEGKSKLNDYYYIGDLKTENGTYRLTFFLKKDDGQFKIKQLRVE
jgi:hypothetical protein